ncbi:MAG: CoA transferase [Burkholderiaceae bacterium]|nr:CoA transferase [Burkholderiaceae bacterium]
MSTVSSGALAGLRILDCTHALAGPFCTQILADHGADVVKIEPPEGDFFRRTGPYAANDTVREYGGLFQFCNRNKRGIVIDLKQPEGRELFGELVQGADALVENYRAGVLDRLGLGFCTLSKRNPRLVYTSVRGFGDRAGGSSPYMDWPAFDIVAQAMGGWMGMTGPDADHPTKVGGGLGDTVPGLVAAFGTMAALWNARATGRGQYVDVAMVDSVLALSELLTTTFAYTGTSPKPIGNSMPGMAPFGAVATKDGAIVIAAVHDPQFSELCAAMGRPELISDVRYASEKARWDNQTMLQAEIEAFTSTRTKSELAALFGARVPFGPIYTAREIFEDPHFAARDMLPEIEHPGSPMPVRIAGVPAKLSATPGGVRRRAPLLGEHTLEVLRGLGIPDVRIDRLLASRAIVARQSEHTGV